MDPEGSAYGCFPSAGSRSAPICPASLCGLWRPFLSLSHTLLIELSLFFETLVWFHEQDHSFILETKPQAGSSSHTHFYPACLLASTWPTLTASAVFTNYMVPQCPTWFSKAASPIMSFSVSEESQSLPLASLLLLFNEVQVWGSGTQGQERYDIPLLSDCPLFRCHLTLLPHTEGYHKSHPSIYSNILWPVTSFVNPTSGFVLVIVP